MVPAKFSIFSATLLFVVSSCFADIRGNLNRVRYNTAARNPSKRVLAEFTREAHGLRSGNVTIINSRTIYIPNLHYDGAGPDAFFFLGTGPVPVNGKTLTTGTKIPNEVGSYGILKKYSGESITLKVPSPLDIKNYDWIAVWCVRFTHLFGYVRIPKDLNVPPALPDNRKPGIVIQKPAFSG